MSTVSESTTPLLAPPPPYIPRNQTTPANWTPLIPASIPLMNLIFWFFFWPPLPSSSLGAQALWLWPPIISTPTSIAVLKWAFEHGDPKNIIIPAKYNVKQARVDLAASFLASFSLSTIIFWLAGKIIVWSFIGLKIYPKSDLFELAVFAVIVPGVILWIGINLLMLTWMSTLMRACVKSQLEEEMKRAEGGANHGSPC